MKKLLLTLMAILTVVSSLTATAFTASADEFDNVFEIEINGFDCASDVGRVIVYTNDSDSVRYVKSSDYQPNNLNGRNLFIFNSEGRLVEVGSNIQDDGPQHGVNIPAGGFMVVCRTGSKFDKCYPVVTESAVFFNSTISILHECYATYDDEKITLKYNNLPAVSENATSFLFVGNSSTYFNGSPLKFKALAKAAGVDIDIHYSAFGSAYLHEFADESNTKGQALRRKLNERSYDYVVLQDAAKTSYETTKPQVEKLLPLIEDNGATALLYMRYSAASTAQGIIDNAKKHYDNYATLAKDYSLTCAPSAEAFIFCALEYPEINLYADDGGHHSKEGSYLIACTWLYSYLGISPVGNTYTADMPEETVAKLQECALKACEEGYFERENNDIFQNPKIDEIGGSTDTSSDADTASSEDTSSEDTSSETNVSDESASETSDGVQEPKNDSLAWLYWVIGGVVLVGGIVAAVLISKKK